MALFEIEANGKTFEIDAPDQAAAVSAFGKFNSSQPAKPGVIEDVAKSAGSGLVRGVTGTLGAAGDAATAIGQFSDWAAPKVASGLNKFLGTSLDESALPDRRNGVAEAIGSANLNRGVDAAATAMGGSPVTTYQPKTTAGEYARTAGEFAPGAIVPGGVAAKVVGGVLAPAVASETAGQLAKGTGFETPARIAGALVGGVGGAIASRPTNATAAARGHMTNVADDQVMAAGKLMQDAADRGVALTWPEAIAQTTGNAASLTSLQRVVEGSEKGGEVMRGFMSGRPGQVQTAGREAIGEVAAPIVNPSTIGSQAAREAQGVLAQGERAINDATRPLYKAAEAQIISADDFARIKEIPAFQEAVKSLRSDSILGPQFAGLGDDSVAVIDAVQKRVRDLGDAAKTAGEGYKSSIIGSQRGDIVNAADAAAPTYAAARQAQAQAREKFLQPLLDGPLGRMANGDATTKSAVDALFPRTPYPGSADEVATAVGALAKRAPIVAERLVRAHVESVFDDATRNLTAGANEFGGAKFSAMLTGNAEQAASLEAAVKALPGGADRWNGFRRYLDIVEATGQRQRIGSQTAFNQEIQATLKSGGPGGEIANAAATGGIKLPGRIKEAYEGYRLGKNTSDLARLITDPTALPVFRQLAKEANGGAKAQALAARLTALATQARAASER